MKKVRFSTNFTIFILFFGLGLIEAFKKGEWLEGFFWIAIGVVFLAADSLEKKRE